MRNVKRLSQPESLRIHAAQWTKELMNEIDKKGSYDKVDDSLKNKYRQADVKEALEKMYTGHCCYCESVVGISTYGRIEHLKPKARPGFHQYSFEWTNLHWCCEICNTSYKKTKWDDQYPILDPTVDDITQYLDLNLTTGEYEAIGNDGRALTTIRHTGMNRDRLVKARRRLIIRFVKDYKAHVGYGDEKEFCDEWEKLKEYMDYPSLYEKLMKTLEK